MNQRLLQGDCEVALVISDLGSGGAQRVLVQLARGWSNAGRGVAVITMSAPEHDFFTLPGGVRRMAIGGIGESRTLFRGLVANAARVIRLRRALRTVNAPVVVAFVMQTAVLTVFAAVGLGIRVVACERNDPVRQPLNIIWRMLRRFAYRRASLVTANSHGNITALRRIVPPERLAYLPNPLSCADSSAVAQLAAPTILTIGRLHRQKAQDVLLRGFAKFYARWPNWRLAIIGAGPEERNLKALADDLGITHAVDWLGQQDDPYSWLRATRIFVLPSRYEGTPNALLEAMACGLPCIVSDSSPGPLELVDDDKSGLVIAGEDPVALAGALDRLACDTALAQRLGEAARRRASAHELRSVLDAWEKVLGLCTRKGIAATQFLGL